MADNFFKIYNGFNMSPRPDQPTPAVNGDQYFDDGTNRPSGDYQFVNGAWQIVGSGSGGGNKNYIQNPDAEGGLAFWSTYSNTAANIPSTGTGGTATGLTFSRSTSIPLNGTASFLLTQANTTNIQGKGVSTDFIIDNADQAKVLQVSFNYNASTTFVAANGTTPPLNDGTTSFNPGNSDIEVFIYDVTNAQLIFVSTQVITANGANNFSFSGTFQTTNNSVNYRLIFHVATSDANATGWTFKFDDVVVSTQGASSYIAPITDWQPYTPTLTNITLGNGYSQGFWKRIGDSVQITYDFNAGSTTTYSAGTLGFSLPPGLIVDDTKLDTHAQESGSAFILTVANGQTYVGVVSPTTNTILGILTTVPTGSFAVSNTVPGTFGTSGAISFSCSYPIIGWSSGVLNVSNNNESRVVAFKATTQLPLGTPSVSPTITIFSSFVNDTHSAYNTATGLYTIPVSGFYQIEGTVEITGTFTVGQYIDSLIRKNGTGDNGEFGCVAQTSLTSQALVYTFSTIVQCTAGDTLGVYSASNGSSSSYTSTVTGSNLSINRLSGPSTITASESVNASYGTAAGPSIPGTGTDTLVPFITKNFDSHSAYNTSTGLYTVPISGVYAVSVTVQSNVHTWTQGNNFYGNLYKNGALYQFIPDSQVQATGSYGPSLVGHTIIQCIAGDTLGYYINQNSGTALTLVLTAQANYFNIHKT